MIAAVVPESPAAKAGIEPGDVIVKAGKKSLVQVQELIDAVEAAGLIPGSGATASRGPEGKEG